LKKGDEGGFCDKSGIFSFTKSLPTSLFQREEPLGDILLGMPSLLGMKELGKLNCRTDRALYPYKRRMER
jgi:hypothetical protein